MIGVCYCSKLEQNITSTKGTYKLLPLLESGNNWCHEVRYINIQRHYFSVLCIVAEAVCQNKVSSPCLYECGSDCRSTKALNALWICEAAPYSETLLCNVYYYPFCHKINKIYGILKSWFKTNYSFADSPSTFITVSCVFVRFTYCGTVTFMHKMKPCGFVMTTFTLTL